MMKYFLLAILLFTTTIQAQEVVNAYTYDKWGPTKPGECSREIHNLYSAINPRDGKRYPIWHPTQHVITPAVPATETTKAVPAVTCPFGHNHASNPESSYLYSLVGITYYGEVAEIMSEQETLQHRHEDHFGYKTHVANVVHYKSATGRPLVCSMMDTFHMGTHSADAFTNNQHEQQIAIQCNYEDGAGEFALFNHVKILTAAGAAGQIMQSCSPNELIQTGPAVPSDSPTTAVQNIGKSIGRRKIPTEACVLVNSPTDNSITEVWETANTWMSPQEILAPATATLPARSYSPKRYATALQINWYPNAGMPSRLLDTRTMTLGRTIDACFVKNDLGAFINNSGRCLGVRKLSGDTPMQWDDVRSPWKGANVGIRLTTLQQNYPAGPEDFCTDVRGLNGANLNADDSCPKGMVKQHISNTDLRDIATGLKPAVYTSTAEVIHYVETDPTVHAPN